MRSVTNFFVCVYACLFTIFCFFKANNLFFVFMKWTLLVLSSYMKSWKSLFGWNDGFTRCEKLQIRSIFWSVFSSVWAEYGHLWVALRIQSECKKKNTDQKRLGIWTLHAVVVPLKCCLYWVFSSFCQRGKCHLFVLLSNILVIPSSHKQVHDQEEYRFIVYRSLQSLVSI